MNFNYIRTLIIITTLVFILQSCTKNEKEADLIKFKIQNDSINTWLKQSKDDSYSLEKRKELLNKCYQNIKSSEIDTLLPRSLSVLAYQYLKLGDTILFKKRNQEALLIASKAKDSYALGDIYWNYASYYNKLQEYDSAYYHFDLSYNYFDKSGFIFEAAKTQYGMAFIKGRYKDYSGSEVLIFKAIDKFEKINSPKSLFSCYNHLGTLQNDIYEYDKSLFYYNKALEYKENKTQYAAIENNIGNTYLKKGDYAKAIDHFNNVLNIKNLKSTNTIHYARVLSNKAYAKLLKKDTLNIEKELHEALHIRDSLNNKGGIIISKIHLAHFFAYKRDTIAAINSAKAANALAKELKNSRDYLESLNLLAKLDTQHTSEYLKNHIRYSDSIQIVDRKIQNKFTRIAYETDEYIQETKRLSRQKIWILLSSFGLISILSLLYFIKVEKSKNEKLLFENNEQKANEQIYLIALKQQEKLEVEKIKERNRIAEELHDGILGKLFGTRIGLGFLDIEANNEIKEQYQLFLDELQDIEKEIREVSHRLSDNIDSTQISFTKIVNQLIINNSKIGSFEYELSFDENIDWRKINEQIKVNLYKILQEALQNIIKYASAKHVSVIFFTSDDEDLEITIQDDGIGFNIKQKKKGIGLKNMKSRIKKLNGSFNIYSEYGNGTTIKILIPI